MMIAAVITNLGLILITDNKFDVSTNQQWINFVLVEHLFLVAIWILQAVIPDEKQETTDLKIRHSFVAQTKYYT